ncbi:putative ferric-chelate reductase 1 homolog [Saccostrea echinata]|uniref:putative ferric-chelate reductase 1 homolog n=1 Tax=Saccostrea echinata TaxID=191078 RepID=UPI002A7EE8AC|nr:putative ferric-chelate reductase 1 homolog [Saccostrea echinata]
MSLKIPLLVIFVCGAWQCRAYPSGAPGCKPNSLPVSEYDFIPSHGSTVDDQNLPYYVNATNSGKEWTVVIWAENSYFKGLLLRVIPLNSSNTVTGTYVTMPSDTRNCSDSDATHTNADTNHTSLMFVWRQSDAMTGDVYFKATIVHTKSTNYKITASSVPNPGTTVTPSASTQTAITMSTAPQSGISPDPECGSTKGCLSSCSGGACSYLITWQKRGDLVRFELMIMSSENRYQAIGFSSDNKMGGDSVMVCKSYGGTVTFELGHTVGTTYSNLPSLTGTGVNVLESSQTDGRVRCVIERTINSTNSYVFSLTRSWHLLRAIGPLPGGAVTYHSTRTASSSQVDFLSASLITEEQPDNLMVKIHGSFMMIAWVMFSSIGIVTARFFKDGWEGKTLMGQKVWFQIHRTSMVSVFLFTVSAFVVIFVDVGEYREVVVADDRDYLKYHPILGIVVTSLTVINPIMSLFRCAPTDKKRPLFNVAHFLVGTGAHILAAITVLFGMNIDRSNLPVEASYVMYAYMAVFVVIEITFELHRVCQKGLNSNNHVAMEMKNFGDKSEKSIQFEESPMIKKEVFLYFHMLLMVAFCVSMVVILITS